MRQPRLVDQGAYFVVHAPKVWRDKQADSRDQGLGQLEAYLEQLGLDRGVLVIFDRRTGAPPVAERIAFEQTRTAGGRDATILRA